MTTDHQVDREDQELRRQFESFTISPDEFSHAIHVRLAYVYLVDNDVDTVYRQFRQVTLDYLKHHDIDPSKYNETLTRAWILAIRHFMMCSSPTKCSSEFVDSNPRLLNSRIMQLHYSKQLLFSDEARLSFIEPDLAPIPRY